MNNDEDNEKEAPLPEASKEIVPQPVDNFNLQTIITAAVTQNVSVETMERLLALAEKMQAIKAKMEFDKAMAKAQSEMPVIQKKKIVYEKGSSTNIRYKYAPIDDIVDQVKKPIADNGLSYTFDEVKDEKFAEIVCIVTHVLGHSQRTGFKIPIGTEAYMSDVQKYGARMTFGKRYAFCNAFGIMTGDEDTDAQEEDKPNAPLKAEPTVQEIKPSKAQMDLIVKLMEQKNIKKSDITEAGFTKLTGGKEGTASKLIDYLLKTPGKPIFEAELPTITIEQREEIEKLGDQI